MCFDVDCDNGFVVLNCFEYGFCDGFGFEVVQLVEFGCVGVQLCLLCFGCVGVDGGGYDFGFGKIGVDS